VNETLTQNLLVFGGVLFVIGMVGFLTRRSLILMFLSLEMMLSGVSVNLIAFSRHHQNYQGQILAIMVLTIAACEAAIALALVVSLYRRKQTLDIAAWDELSETLIPKVVDAPATLTEPDMEFPKLTPAGLDPLSRPIFEKFDAQSNANGESVKAETLEAGTHA
jgi:NADH-quinone oxidoreductase subunit K